MREAGRTLYSRRILLWAIAAVVCCVAGTTFAEISAITTLYVCGDSTAANGHDRGWANHLQEFFDPAKLRIVNRARGGRSSRTFLTEGLWDAVMADVKPGDFVVIQFGHNGKVIRAEGYPDWSAEVAASEKCQFVDVSNIIADRYDEMGESAVKPLFPEEHTHTSADGAKLNAELIVSGLNGTVELQVVSCASFAEFSS